MKTSLAIAVLLCVSILLSLSGCTRIARSLYLSSYDRDIRSAQGRAKALAITRAAPWPMQSEAALIRKKPAMTRISNCSPPDEYDRLFGLAVKDHDQAIALDPSAEAYYTRGGNLLRPADPQAVVDGRLMGSEADRKAWFGPATADFKKAVEKDSQLYLAWDRLGLIDETTGELDQAISDYTQEMALNPLGRVRLTDAYCSRAGSKQKDKKNDALISDYEKSIELGATADGCSCDPYNPLLALYKGGRQYDQAWELFSRARKSKK